MKFGYGSTRTVLLMGSWAIKMPTCVEWRLFVQGMLANDQEVHLSKLQWPQLCPVLFSLPFGLMVVMKRARPLTLEEFDEFSRCHSQYIREYQLSLKNPFGEESFIDVEHKLDTFGYLGDQVVAVDYGN